MTRKAKLVKKRASIWREELRRATEPKRLSALLFLSAVILLLVVLSACNREVYIPPYHTPTLPPAKLSIIRDGTVENDSLSSEPATVVTEMFDTSVYTEQNPATDPSEINALLEIIKQRYLSGITKEGWYASTDEYHTGQMWVYISDPENKTIKEMFATMFVFNYSNPLGDVIMRQMLLPDGSDGFFGMNDSRSDTVVKRTNNYPGNMTYSMGGGFPPYFDLLENYFVNAMIDLSLIQGNPEEQSPFQIETAT